MTAVDIVRFLARQPAFWALSFEIYAPRSGSARQAIAAGADPAPLLLDVGHYGLTLIRSRSEVDGFLDGHRPLAGEVLALNSSVLCSGGASAHLLLLDFAVPVSPEAQAELVHMLTFCGWLGWLLVSGASYHFIGREPMPLDDWRRAMARALLIPGIDYRCTGHALHGERGAVRLTTCPAKPTEPHVVAALGGRRVAELLAHP